MPLPDFLDLVDDRTTAFISYFALLPFTALLTGFMDRRESRLPPWNYLSSALLFGAAIPAVAALGLLGYSSTQDYAVRPLVYLLPLVSLVLTVLFLRRQVPLSALPGLGGAGPQDGNKAAV